MSDIHLNDKPSPVKPRGYANSSLHYRTAQSPVSPPEIPYPNPAPQPPQRAHSTFEPPSRAERDTDEMVPPSITPAPLAVRHVALLEMIRRTNEYLAASAPEFKLVRQDRCQELEYFLISTNNFQGFQFLEPNPQDTSRRRYNIPNRVLVGIAR